MWPVADATTCCCVETFTVVAILVAVSFSKWVSWGGQDIVHIPDIPSLLYWNPSPLSEDTLLTSACTPKATLYRCYGVLVPDLMCVGMVAFPGVFEWSRFGLTQFLLATRQLLWYFLPCMSSIGDHQSVLLSFHSHCTLPVPTCQPLKMPPFSHMSIMELLLIPWSSSEPHLLI